MFFNRTCVWAHNLSVSTYEGHPMLLFTGPPRWLRKAWTSCVMTAYENYVALRKLVADEHSPWSKSDGSRGCYGTELEVYHCLKFKGLRLHLHHHAIKARATIVLLLSTKQSYLWFLCFWFYCVFVCLFLEVRTYVGQTDLKLAILLKMTHWVLTDPPPSNSQVLGVHACHHTQSVGC